MRLFVLLLSSLSLMTCENLNTNSSQSQDKMNHLAKESSPYLLQHARNPVDWYPWGEEALQKAKDENKMLIVSVGYAACHWCHVMEHESFEDSTVAALMNEHFVSIKVDREERPDIDNIYMTACQLSSERGCGWPLNAFALPDGRPVWAATYFPKEQWMGVLNNFIEEKAENPERLEEYAAQLTKGIQSTESLVKVEGQAEYDKAQISEWAVEFHKVIDFRRGGRKGEPKFPMPGMYEFLLKHHQQSGNPESLEAVKALLDNMASAGIYDQVGGAFARYSVDAEWKVPHFEKMLYDNGQLLSLYSHAYQLYQEDDYLRIIDQTIQFMKNEWSSEKGGLYSSYDADSQGVEGKYYVWDKEELLSVIDPETADAFLDYYNITAKGNWEHSNILHADQDLTIIAKKHGLTAEVFQSKLKENLAKLYIQRESRIKPSLDDKILSSWNGIAISGLIDAYRATGQEEYLAFAQKNAEFIRDNMLKDDFSLFRNHKDGNSVINAFLDDYALVIRAWIDMYQVTFDTKWLDEAASMMDYAKEHFEDPTTEMFYYNSSLDPELIARKTELMDNVIPGSNSSMAHNLFDLGVLLDRSEYKKQSLQMLNNMIPQISQSHFFYHWCSLYLKAVNPPFEVAIVGDDYKTIAAKMQRSYQGDVLFVGSEGESELALLEGKYQEGVTMIYVCQNKVCKLPVSEEKMASELLLKERKARTL